MATLPLHAAHPSRAWPISGLARVGAFLALILDTYDEAQQTMRETNKKYPFAGL